MRETGFRFFPLPVNIALLFLGILAFTQSANPELSVIALLTLMVLPKIVWLRGHPPLILICLMFQWVQANTKLIQANLAKTEINQYAGSSDSQTAVILAEMAILVLAIAIHLIIRSKRKVTINSQMSVPFSIHKLFNLYLLFFGFAFFVSGILFFVPGLTQILLSLTYIRWVFYAAVFYAVMIKKENYYYVVVLFIVEFIYNSLGYYASFKEVIFITSILLFTLLTRVKLSLVIVAVPTLVVIFNVFVIWNDIKTEYRGYLDYNLAATFNEKLDKIQDLYNGFDDYDEALESALDRISYIHMFIYCIETVPEKVPHEGGNLWISAIQNVLMPRIIFPNKRVLHDSEKANAYTGREWAGIDQLTSISIGYISESYVDFGFGFMYVPIFILGLLIGFIYKSVLSNNFHPLLLFSIVIPLIYFTKFNLIETSNDKLLGALMMNFIVFSAFVRYGMPRIVQYLQK